MQRRGVLRALSLASHARNGSWAASGSATGGAAGRALGWQLHAPLPGAPSLPLRRRFLSNAFRGEAGEIPRDPARQVRPSPTPPRLSAPRPLAAVAHAQGSVRPPRLRRGAHAASRPAPPQPSLQVELLQQLNRAGQPEAVVTAFESGAVAASEGALGEYVKALTRLDRLDGSRLLSTLQRGAVASGAAAPPPGGGSGAWYGAGAGGGGGGGGGAGTGLPAGIAAALGGGAAAAAGVDDGGVGTARNPLVITHAEPSMGAQVLRLVRSLLLAFILVTAVGAFLDEKSLTKGMMSNPDLKPQMESNTK
jgi:hypothetical protein